MAGGAGGGGPVDVSCQFVGQTISGSVRRRKVWNRLTDGRYVSDAYVSWSGGRPAIETCVIGRGRAVTATALNVRSHASTLLAPVSRLAAGATGKGARQLARRPPTGTSRRPRLWGHR